MLFQISRTSIPVLAVLALATCSSPTAFAQNHSPTRENLGPQINTLSIEILPLVSDDGKTLFFDRKFDSLNMGGKKDEDDIYYSTLLPDGSWSRAKNIGEPLNSAGSDVVFWVSTDGNTLVMHSGRKVAGGELGLALAHRTNGTWSIPEPLEVANLPRNLGESYYVFVAPDLAHLFIAYARDPKQPENLDIFVAPALDRTLKHWGTPVSVGPSINTAKFEGAPFMATDNQTLYFSSDGHGGTGFNDLFLAHRLDTSWTRWSEPVNLGEDINTKGYDASLSIAANGDYIYLSGSPNVAELNFGKSDIYRVKLPDNMRPQKVVLVRGTLHAESKPLHGLIRAEVMGERTEIASTASNDQGAFTLSLPEGRQYKITGWSIGYDQEGSAAVDATTSRGKVLEADINLGGAGTVPSGVTTNSPVAGVPVPSSTLLFAFRSSELTGESIHQLEQFAKRLKAMPFMTGDVIRITGYTDSIGTDAENRTLSLQRANAVRDWLVAQGISIDRFAVVAKGTDEPIAANSDEKGRRQNRRVVVEVGVK